MLDEADLAIVGGGVAALTAAAFGVRLGLRATVVSDILVGGQIINVDAVANYPGFPEPISGGDLAAVIEQQARDAGAEFVFGEALSLSRHGDVYTVQSTDGDVLAPAVIVATGSRLRRLGVPGEDRLDGAGVSYCGSCDGPMFTGSRVAVVGGGDSAADEALVVAEHAAEVVVLMREGELSAAAATASRVLAHERIVVRPYTEPLEIVGEDRVSAVRLRDVRGGELTELQVDGLFVFVGLEPNTGLLSELLELDEGGHVVTDPWMATTVPGLFAAGDIRRDSPRQLVNVASDGATAAIAAHRYLLRLGR